MRHVIVVLTFIGLTAAFAAGPASDASDSARLIFKPKWQAPQAKTAKDAASAYVKANWNSLGLKSDAVNLRYDSTKVSLLGEHHYFQQVRGGIPVEDAIVVVSISRKDGSIYRVYNRSFEDKAPTPVLPRFFLDSDDAMDVSWNHLRVHGGLTTMPNSQLVWLPKDGEFTLAWRVNLSTDMPSGAWSMAVDANTGKVLSLRDIRSHGKGDTFDPIAYDGPVSSREDAVEEFRKRQEFRKLRRAKFDKKAEGTGLVFDPDPRTTLMDSSIEDFDPPETFDPAYYTKPLRDIAFDADSGLYSLTGPWCNVEALDIGNTGPNTPPSTTTDGNWTAKRGDNAFNDAMTYYHIDDSQRYMQALGFIGATGIQQGPIDVDTDALFGDDNSFFDPNANALAFGHGCVDDNEDADVIYHEYGHAIQHSIDRRWSGNSVDAGAIGEGFGDYWGASYSLKTPNGPIFFPEWIYSWDGHGDSDFCWQGRLMDVVTAQYDSNRTYNVHRFVNDQFGGFITDELWGTPIFQALFELYNRGIPQAEADRIVLEAHFGMPGSLSMPAMAQATVDAAAMLHPDGPHAHWFQEAFARHNILPHVNSYTYYAIHVPPGDASWQNEIELTNPSGEAANVTATVFEADSGDFLANFAEGTSSNFQIAAGETSVFTPDGAAQRWVRFSSDKPLAGTSFFFRTPGADRGLERAGIPLSAETETGTTIIYPHVPANRTKFWSGAVVLNPNGTSAPLNIRLIGESGNDLSNLLSNSAPTNLGANQKWVTFLAPGPGGAAGIFDDSGSAEKVSYVEITSSQQLTGFQLYGYQDGLAATSGILATPDQNRTHWPVRVSLTGQNWAGLSMLNPDDEAHDLNVRAYDTNGSLLGEAVVRAEPRRKLLGLNTVDGGFAFPSNGTPAISLGPGSGVQTLLITSDDYTRTFGVPTPLRVFELGGQLDDSELDGAAVLGLATQVVFARPAGQIEIFKAEFDGELTVVTRANGGESSETLNVQANHTASISVPDGVDSIEIRGKQFSASMITQDAEGALTVINGKPVEFVSGSN